MHNKNMTGTEEKLLSGNMYRTFFGTSLLSVLVSAGIKLIFLSVAAVFWI